MALISGQGDSWFLTLNKKSAWEQGLFSFGLRTTAEGIGPEESVDYRWKQTLDLDALLGGIAIKDFAAGQDGLLFLLDSKRRVWVIDPDREVGLPVEWDGLFQEPVSIAATPDTLFVADAGAQAQAVIFAFARLNWQIRWTVPPVPADGDRLIPGEVAVDAAGRLYVLDRANSTLARISRGGILERRYHLGPPGEKEWIDMAVSDDVLFVLNRTDRRCLVIRFDLPGKPYIIDIGSTLGASFKHLAPSSLCTAADGSLYIGDNRAIPAPSKTSEDERFIHKFSPAADGTYTYMGVISGHRGPVTKLAAGAGDQLYILYEGAKIDVLSPVRGPLPTGAYTFFSGAFDSTAPGTRWHKLVLDAVIPENTQVRLAHIISDDPGAVSLKEGAVDRLDQLNYLNSLAWSSPLVNPGDALVFGPPGRYLWLKMDMVARERQAPLVKSIRLHFPRQSYLRYLPAVYQEDEQGRDFLERFLSLFETMFDGLERKIDHLARYCDVAAQTGDGAGAAFLRWLASWLAIVADGNWTDEALRSLVRQAPDLYRKRGTRPGIEAMVEVYTGCRPLIVEHFQLHGVLQQTHAGQDPELPRIYKRLFSTEPFSFCVLLQPFQRQEGTVAGAARGPDGDPAGARFSDEEIASVGRILEQEAPAHTRAWLIPLQPWVVLGWHTYLGVNTYLSRPLPILDSGRIMHLDTVLTDVDEAGQIARRSRAGMDTSLS